MLPHWNWFNDGNGAAALIVKLVSKRKRNFLLICINMKRRYVYRCLYAIMIFRVQTMYSVIEIYRQIVLFHLPHDFVYAIAATENQKFKRRYKTKNDSQCNRKICSITENLLQAIVWCFMTYWHFYWFDDCNCDFDWFRLMYLIEMENKNFITTNFNREKNEKQRIENVHTWSSHTF